jgi:hypothetical protein
MSNDIVPFGKYKGQPLQRLAQDTEYLAWLRQQSWFLQKFGWIDKAIIVIQHGPAEPEETPEHNRLQARFLDRRFCWAVLTLLYPRLLRTQDRMSQEIDRLMAERVKVCKELAEEKASDLAEADKSEAEARSLPATGIEKWARQSAVDRAKRLREEAASRAAEEKAILDVVRTIPRLPVPLSGKKIDRTFETGNIDVMLAFDVEYPLSDPVMKNGSDYSCILKPAVLRVTASAKIECKPDLGDDYPAVLRQMNRNHSDTLLVGTFASQVIGLDDLKQFFADSGKRVLLLAEVETVLAALPPGARSASPVTQNSTGWSRRGSSSATPATPATGLFWGRCATS